MRYCAFAVDVTSQPLISVISVFNKSDILEDFLMDSLSSVDYPQYEEVLIDNSDGQFDSAAAALNAGAERASGAYYFFVHQDVKFLSENWMGKIYDYIKNLPDLGVAGVTGMACQSNAPFDRGRNNIYHGPGMSQWKRGNDITEPTKVQTVDEMFFVVDSNIFDRFRLDEEICNGWHLYAVEYCLRLKYRTEYEVYVLPLDVWHRSTGMTVELDYYQTLIELGNKYKEPDLIHTTVGSWINNSLYLLFIHHLNKYSRKILGNQVQGTVDNWWPLFFGGAIPALYEHQFSAVSDLAHRFIRRI